MDLIFLRMTLKDNFIAIISIPQNLLSNYFRGLSSYQKRESSQQNEPRRRPPEESMPWSSALKNRVYSYNRLQFE